MHKPLRVDEVTLTDGTPALATDGAPSDAVALAFLGLVERPIDIVVSGVNRGANLGHDVTYSGTVTAAMEASISGAAAIAVSLDSLAYDDYSVAAGFASRLANEVLSHKLGQPILLNVNVPPLPRDQIAGVLVTHMGLRIYRDELVYRVDPRGRPYYWIGGPEPTGVEEKGTDIWAVANRFISVTPLQLDLTSHRMVSALESWPLVP
jgi:5'-nucleotidase